MKFVGILKNSVVLGLASLMFVPAAFCSQVQNITEISRINDGNIEGKINTLAQAMGHRLFEEQERVRESEQGLTTFMTQDELVGVIKKGLTNNMVYLLRGNVLRHLDLAPVIKQFEEYADKVDLFHVDYEAKKIGCEEYPLGGLILDSAMSFEDAMKCNEQFGLLLLITSAAKSGSILKRMSASFLKEFREDFGKEFGKVLDSKITSIIGSIPMAQAFFSKDFLIGGRLPKILCAPGQDDYETAQREGELPL